MTANQFRALIAAGYVIVGAAILLTTPPVGKGDVFDTVFGWIVIALVVVGIAFDVKEHFADRAELRREDREDADRSVGIAILRDTESGETR